MSNKTVWFVTGAGRGMGVDIAKAALAAGHAVVATGRSTDAVTKALGTAKDLLVLKLDVLDGREVRRAPAVGQRWCRTGLLVTAVLLVTYPFSPRRLL